MRLSVGLGLDGPDGMPLRPVKDPRYRNNTRGYGGGRAALMPYRLPGWQHTRYVQASVRTRGYRGV